MQRLKSSLIMGRTGILATATDWLISQSSTTYAITRHASAVAESSDLCLLMLTGTKKFSGPNSNALSAVLSIECALLWLHEPETILPWLSRHLTTARVVLVLGSSDGQPDIPPSVTSWATVRLSSTGNISGRRWLTHDEISAGAIASLEDGFSRIVGELISIP